MTIAEKDLVRTWPRWKRRAGSAVRDGGGQRLFARAEWPSAHECTLRIWLPFISSRYGRRGRLFPGVKMDSFEAFVFPRTPDLSG